jgi:hypothetical protein
MNLLSRIAHSNGDPQRTITALRFINECLEHELDQHQTYYDQLCRKGLLARLQPANPSSPKTRIEPGSDV